MRVILGEWWDQEAGGAFRLRGNDPRRAFYSILRGSSFRVETKFRLSPLCIVWEHAHLSAFRAFEHVLIWFDPAKLTHFSCPSLCPFLVTVGMFSEHMCLIRTFWQVHAFGLLRVEIRGRLDLEFAFRALGRLQALAMSE